MIDLDVETTGVQWYAHDLFLVQLNTALRDVHVHRHPDARAAVQKALDVGSGYRAWNTKFDMHFLDAAGYRLPDPSKWHDGMVQAHILDENRSVALKAVAEKMFGPQSRDEEKRVKDWLRDEAKRRREESKDTGKLFVEPSYADVPSDIMVPYAAQDVALTRQICEQFDVAFRANPELQAVYDFEREVLAALFFMEKRGIPIDVEAAHAFEEALVQRVEKLEEECIKLAGKRNFNPNSPEQIRKALKHRGADLTFCRKTGTGISMDAESLRTVDDPLAQAILAFRAEYKNLSTYVRPLLHPSWDASLRSTKAPFITSDGLIHPNIRQVGARTGRTSASDPNIQNWPRDDLRLRYLFRAEEGKVLVGGDLDSIELRLFAAYAGWGKLKELLTNGEDIHTHTAEMVGLTERRRAGGVESKRQRGKTFNYSMVYGAGVRSLRRAFNVSQQEARAMLDRYHAAYPEVQALQQSIAFKLRDRGYIKTIAGRRLHVSDQEAYKGTNYLIQGTAAEIMKRALVRMHKKGYPVIATVHDELILHLDKGDVQEAQHDLIEALTDHPEITERMPLAAETFVAERWSQAKDPHFQPEFAKILL